MLVAPEGPLDSSPPHAVRTQLARAVSKMDDFFMIGIQQRRGGIQGSFVPWEMAPWGRSFSQCSLLLPTGAIFA